MSKAMERPSSSGEEKDDEREGATQPVYMNKGPRGLTRLYRRVVKAILGIGSDD